MARGRKKRKPESDPEVLKAQEHGRQRQLYRAGNSWVVPVPPWARRWIERERGGAVYWFEGRTGEVVLTGSPTRIGGRPPGETLQREIARARRENTRLRRRLRQWPLAQLAQADSIGAMKGMRATLPDGVTLDEMLRLLREIYARMPLRRRSPRAERAPTTERPVEPAPAPVLEAPREVAKPTTCVECGALKLDDEACPACAAPGLQS